MNPLGQVAFVSGGASGLGAATARRLAQAGAQVVVLDVAREQAEMVARDCGGRAFVCDLGDDTATEAAVGAAIVAVGAPRILVNCAGIGNLGLLLRQNGPAPMAELRRVIDVNLMGSFNVLRLCAWQMQALEPLADGERGVIINTSSIAAFDGMVGQGPYSASKGAIAAMSLPLSRELGHHGIRVLDIAPGFFQTPLIDNLPERSREIAYGLKPSFPRRAGQPEEFAALVQAIVENPMLNGTTVRLDGGLRTPPTVPGARS